MKDSHILKLANYQSYANTETIQTSYDWVKNGDDDNLPDILIDLYNTSAVNNALCTTIAMLIYGNGFTSDSNLDEELKRGVLNYKVHGGFYLEVIWSRDGKKVVEVNTIGNQKIRAGEKVGGEIRTWYYSEDGVWGSQIKPQAIPTFNPLLSNNQPIQILSIGMTGLGKEYYFTPDYIGSLDWIELDRSSANYLVNYIKNNLHVGYVVNFNNGQPSEEEQRAITKKLERKMSGDDNAGKFFVNFNDDKEKAMTFDPVEVSNAAEQYDFIINSAAEKIMVGHRVTSPILFGIRVATGFGNNADEMQQARALFEEFVVNPHRNTIIKDLQPLVQAMGVTFKNEAQDTTARLSDEDDWILFDEEEVIGGLEDEARRTAEIDGSFQTLAKAGKPNPNAKSDDIDAGVYKIRYKYTGSQSPERDFCKKMMKQSNAGVEYRYEDIKAMSKDKETNPGWGPNGANEYDIFLYKGGGNCYHAWMRRIYIRKRDKGKFMPNDGLKNDRMATAGEARKVIKKDVEKGWKTASVKPINMPNQGFLK